MQGLILYPTLLLVHHHVLTTLNMFWCTLQTVIPFKQKHALNTIQRAFNAINIHKPWIIFSKTLPAHCWSFYLKWIFLFLSSVKPVILSRTNWQHSVWAQCLCVRVPGLGELTCFIGYYVGFGHRLLVTQINRGAPLKTGEEQEESAHCYKR